MNRSERIQKIRFRDRRFSCDEEIFKEYLIDERRHTIYHILE